MQYLWEQLDCLLIPAILMPFILAIFANVNRNHQSCLPDCECGKPAPLRRSDGRFTCLECAKKEKPLGAGWYGGNGEK